MKGKNPATKRTKEELDLFYSEYLNGSSLDEISLKYKTDAGYQLRKYKYLTRTPGKTRLLKRKLNITDNYIKYHYKFESISNEIEAYIVGFFYADGWVSNKQCGIRLQIKDQNILSSMKDYISTELCLRNQKNNIGFIISSEEICNNLISLGCLRHKTYKKLSIPKMDESLIRHFIRGYFDADGTIYKDNQYLKANICSINKEFLEDLQTILTNQNIVTSINTEIREGKSLVLPSGKTSLTCKNMHRLFIRQQQSFKYFYDYLYKDSTIYLNRKKEKFNNGDFKSTQEAQQFYK